MNVIGEPLESRSLGATFIHVQHFRPTRTEKRFNPAGVLLFTSPHGSPSKLVPWNQYTSESHGMTSRLRHPSKYGLDSHFPSNPPLIRRPMPSCSTWVCRATAWHLSDKNACPHTVFMGLLYNKETSCVREKKQVEAIQINRTLMKQKLNGCSVFAQTFFFQFYSSFRYFYCKEIYTGITRSMKKTEKSCLRKHTYYTI